MASDENDDRSPQRVLVNEEEQCSLWPRESPIPNGWRLVKEGSKAECLAYVKEVWTDIQPLRLRKHMEELPA